MPYIMRIEKDDVVELVQLHARTMADRLHELQQGCVPQGEQCGTTWERADTSHRCVLAAGHVDPPVHECRCGRHVL